MRLISSILRAKLEANHHLYNDSEDMISKIRSVRFDNSLKVYRFDIKDFYLASKHSTIISQVQKDFPSDERDSLIRLLSTILDSQFVRYGEAPTSSVFRVTRGTGMGSLASGELSDTTFYHLVEKPFTLDPRVQREFGVAHYGRFRDDGIICFLNTTSSTRLRFFQRMQELAADYELTAEVADTDNIEMLDVSFFRGRMFDDHGVLDYRLFSKPSSVWRPLSQLSGHPSRVHQFWPRLQLRRIRKRFSCPAQAGRAQEEFRRKMFSASGIWFSELQPKAQTALRLTDRLNGGPWLVLPYHHCWTGIRLGAINRRLQFPGDLVRIGVCFPRISWKLGSQRLVHLLQSTTRKNTTHDLDN